MVFLRRVDTFFLLQLAHIPEICLVNDYFFFVIPTVYVVVVFVWCLSWTYNAYAPNYNLFMICISMTDYKQIKWKFFSLRPVSFVLSSQMWHRSIKLYLGKYDYSTVWSANFHLQLAGLRWVFWVCACENVSFLLFRLPF